MKVTTPNAVLNVFEAGAENSSNSRPTLIFLHYFAGSSRSWTEVIGKLAREYHCLAPDLRGFGESQNSADSFTLEDYADDIESLIEHLKLKKFSLVGHSMGGKIAVACAVRQPANLQSLFLFAPSPPTPEPMKNAERARLLTTYGNRKAAEQTVKNGIDGDLPPEIYERAVADNLGSSEKAWRSWLETESRRDISAGIEKIKVPTFVAAGEKDEAMTADLLNREIVGKLENASLQVIEGCKHLLPLEVPVKIAEMIRRRKVVENKNA